MSPDLTPFSAQSECESEPVGPAVTWRLPQRTRCLSIPISAVAPVAGFSPLMCHGQDLHGVLGSPIEQSERETSKLISPDVL
jgi:hypothetical protein